MRAAVIFGLGSSEKDLKPFRATSDATWLIGLPASSVEADVILIFGGDGTVHRHLAELVRLQLPVLVVPCGSGNDFARALNLRSVRDSLAAWRKFASGGQNARHIDLGLIVPLQLGSELPAPQLSTRYSAQGTRYYFCCVAGVGLDAEVARLANELPRWLRGSGGYALSLPPALARFAPFPLKISAQDAAEPDQWHTRCQQPTILAAFANAPTYGGGMKIAPQAKLDDGQLDVCVIRDIDKFKLFCLFPTVYFGRHVNIPQVEYFQAKHLRVETEKALDVYADGEFVCRTPLEVSVAERALPVITP